MSMFIGMGFLGVKEDKYQRTQKLASASDHICCACHHGFWIAQCLAAENPLVKICARGRLYDFNR